jgi:hypothetical protein
MSEETESGWKTNFGKPKEIRPVPPGHVRCVDPLIYFFWVGLRSHSYDAMRGIINRVQHDFRQAGPDGVYLDNKPLADVAADLAARLRGER